MKVCELYCGGGEATVHQVGWWPDTYACYNCRVQWDLLCRESAGCRELASWHYIQELACTRGECKVELHP